MSAGEEGEARIAVKIAQMHQNVEIRSGHGLGKIETLAEVAAESRNLVVLCRILYALGDGGYSHDALPSR